MSKIMLVDDNEVIIDLYERTLKEVAGMEIIAKAKDGEEAIKILENNVENINVESHAVNTNIENSAENINVENNIGNAN